MITIKELLTELQEVKAAWTAQDTKYLGAFEDQPIMIGSSAKPQLEHADKILYTPDLGLLVLAKYKA